MSVRAKFVCQSITRDKTTLWDGGKSVPAEVQTIRFSPVTGGQNESDENKKFWAATPSGNVELGTVNAAAGNYFELGEAYYLDFTKAN